MDVRHSVAKYYDLAPHHPDDVPFYLARVREESRVLELGCGTGRVCIPLARRCAALHGVDHSDSMLEICRTSVARDGIERGRIKLSKADISDFDIGDTFDLIIAPFRVIQNLETEDQLQGLFGSIRRHLAPSGRCIVNAFRPNRPRQEMVSSWASPTERLAWEVETDEGIVRCYDRRLRVTTDPLVLHPELVYRRFRGDHLVDEAVLRIAMRCFYPEELLEKVESAGFAVTNTWGGYRGEAYGEGSELVVEFAMDA